MSFWLIQNADIFILSRFVDHEELGVYHLASRLGFVVSFLPQGFRMGMRPLRKSAVYDAFKEQYGKGTAGGQLLAYFTLICILAVLAMVLAGQVLVDIVPPAYAGAASLIPLTSLAFVGRRSTGRSTRTSTSPKKRPLFVGGVIAAALLFIGITWVLAPVDRRLRGAGRDDPRLLRAGARPLSQAVSAARSRSTSPTARSGTALLLAVGDRARGPVPGPE